MNVEDGGRDDAEAARRLPGPDYYEVLRWIHAVLRPEVYLEIGVLYGESLCLASPPTLAIGVDPDCMAEHAWRATTRIHRMTSDEFFAQEKVPEISLALIDGSHRFEDTLRDFGNVERHSGARSVILLHDTIPLDERTACPVRGSVFHTGDAWKMLAYFAMRRPELEVVTVRTAPSGLTMVRNLQPGRACEEDAGTIAGLGWEWHSDHLVTIENSRAAVEGWLLRQ